jgi:hypothetical protein
MMPYRLTVAIHNRNQEVPSFPAHGRTPFVPTYT